MDFVSRQASPAIEVRVGGQLFALPTTTIEALPDAAAFLGYLLERGISAASAREYTRLVAKSKREGRYGIPNSITNAVEHTAVRAYWKWIEIHYNTRVAPVLRTVINSELRAGIGRLRIGSLVPPFAGKTIPVKGAPRASTNPDGTIAWGQIPKVEIKWVPTEHWTLHVPQPDTPVHVDPCGDCATIELTAAQMAFVAEAFYKAWGPREPSTLPPECFLFGQAPPISIYAPTPSATPVGRVVGLLPNGPLCAAIDQLRGSVTDQPRAFIERINSGGAPDVVVISRAAVGDRLREVLGAVIDAWGGIAPADEPAFDVPEQHENVIPIRPAASDEL